MKRFLLIFLAFLSCASAFSINGKDRVNQLPKYECFKWQLTSDIPPNSVPHKMTVFIELTGDFIFLESGFCFQHEKARGGCVTIPSNLDRSLGFNFKDSTRVDMLQFDPRDPNYGISVKCTTYDKDQKSTTIDIYLINGQSHRFYYTKEKQSSFTVTFSCKVE